MVLAALLGASFALAAPQARGQRRRRDQNRVFVGGGGTAPGLTLSDANEILSVP